MNEREAEWRSSPLRALRIDWKTFVEIFVATIWNLLAIYMSDSAQIMNTQCGGGARAWMCSCTFVLIKQRPNERKYIKIERGWPSVAGKSMLTHRNTHTHTHTHSNLWRRFILFSGRIVIICSLGVSNVWPLSTLHTHALTHCEPKCISFYERHVRCCS